MAYAYKAANWCDDCGERLKDEIDSGTGKLDTGDTNDYPQPGSDDDEADSPNHCEAGAECFNALELDNGSKVGAIVSGLTDEGAYYVRSQKDSPCVRAWLDHYGLEPFTVYLDNLEDRDGCVMCEVHGQGALRWAKDDQTIAGCRWEGGNGDDFAYAMPMDHPGLVAELEKEGYRLNLEAYSAPGEANAGGKT